MLLKCQGVHVVLKSLKKTSLNCSSGGAQNCANVGPSHLQLIIINVFNWVNLTSLLGKQFLTSTAYRLSFWSEFRLCLKKCDRNGKGNGYSILNNIIYHSLLYSALTAKRLSQIDPIPKIKSLQLQ